MGIITAIVAVLGYEIFAELGVDVNNGFGDRQTTTFVDCVAFGKVGEIVAEHTQKGKQVIVSGQLVPNNFEKTDESTGETVTIRRFELQVREFNFVQGGRNEGSETQAEAPATAPAGGGDGTSLF